VGVRGREESAQQREKRECENHRREGMRVRLGGKRGRVSLGDERKRKEKRGKKNRVRV